MRWYCAARRTKPGLVICSQQRRKVTISLAEEVRRRHGELGEAVVGYHVSKDRSASKATQFRGPSTPELLNADIAPFVSVCKRVGIETKDFPTLNAPSEVVIEATMQRMRMLDMLDNEGRLTTMGSSKLSFDFSPEWARTLAKARGILEGGDQDCGSAIPRGRVMHYADTGSLQPPGRGHHELASIH